MKKILLFIFLFLMPVFHTSVFAGESNVKVKIPINLHSVISGCSETKSTWWYECTIKTGFASIQESIWEIIKYFTFLTGLAWILYIIINWIAISMAWLEESWEKAAKENIKKALMWLLLLLLSWMILNFIAPWIYT